MRQNRFQLPLLVLLCCLATACGDQVSTAGVAGSAVDRAQLFLDSSRAMLALGADYWGRAIGDLYYASLQLGRLKNPSLLVKKQQEFHKAVWAVAPIGYRKFFNDTLKNLRATGDYDLIADHIAVARVGLATVSTEGVQNFRKLLDDSRVNLNAHFKRCTGNPPCSDCQSSRDSTCRKPETQQRLTNLDASLMEVLTTQIPGLLRSSSSRRSRENRG